MSQSHATVLNRATWWRWGVLPLLPGAVFLFAFLMRSRVAGESARFTLFDDAMISLSYGRTLAQTGDLVWFPGAERVQGFTNPLWTAYMALIHALGVEGSRAALAVSLTSIVLVLACGALVAGLVFTTAPGEWPHREVSAAFAGGTVPFIYPLAFWSVRGMEVGLLAFLSLALIASLALLLRRWATGNSAAQPLLAMSVTGAVGVLTRLDFLVIAGAVLGWAFLRAPAWESRIRLVLSVALPVFVVVAGLLAFQHGYYGDWLPNTYRLKMEGFGIADRLLRGLASSGKVLPITAYAICAFLLARRTGTRSSRTLAEALLSVWLVCLGYSIWVGGDAWEWAQMGNRYVTVGLPAAVAVSFLGASSLLAHVPPFRKYLLPGLVLACFSGLGYGILVNPFAFDWRLGLAETLLLAVASALCVLAFAWYVRGNGGSPSAWAAGLATAFVLTAATSAPGFVSWARFGGINVRDDALVTDRALEVRGATSREAVVATVWAGAPGYYLARPMIDLLGKSDRFVAESVPQPMPTGTSLATFLPGHNKWDLGYSIGLLRPDVVFQLPENSNTDPVLLADWGYQQRCLRDGSSIYVLTSSQRVRAEQFALC